MRARKLWGVLQVGAMLAVACTATGSDESAQPGPEQSAPKVAQSRCPGLPALVRRVRRGDVTGRGPDITIIPSAPNYVGAPDKPTHSGPWDYLARVPLVLYGPPFVRPVGRIDAPATMADLAPTTARLIGFERWPDRDGRVLDEALRFRHFDNGAGRSPLRSKCRKCSGRKPRVVVTIVWDGVGWNALNAHRSSWPFLRRLMGRGASFAKMDIGSSPSVTPPVHATLGTGAWPSRHGIAGVRMRSPAGELVDPWLDENPTNLRIATLGDLYDRARGNRPVVGMTATVNWHLGMIGHGADFRGGDRDPAAPINDVGIVYGNESAYSFPEVADPGRLESLTDRLDTSDGERDGSWRGRPLEDRAVRYATPAYVRYQQHVLERLVVTEVFGADRVPDLLYVNFKQPDDAGHQWGMYSAEVRRVIAAQDHALRRLVRFLNDEVGRGRWVLMLTADHGMMPYPQESGGWAIRGGKMGRDANAALDRTDDGVGLVMRVVAAGVYVRREQLAANGLTLEDIARWVVRYTVEQNLEPGQELPRAWRARRDEPLFDAALVDGRVVARSCRIGR
ncbi:MAG: alkaline phosphatase family protein [Actinomycetota bacterium]